jgi:plasmid replication initiation protein
MAKQSGKQIAHKNDDTGDLSRSGGDRLVTMSNALTRAAHGLTLAEKRIMAAAVSKLDSRKPPMAGECPVIRLTAAEYAATFEVDMNTAYDQLQAAAKLLFKRYITFFEPAYRRKGKELVKVQMHWVGEAVYHDGEGWVELHLWHRLVPHLLGLKRQFTTYKLQQASALRSVYSWKLLELLMRFESTGWAEYTIEDFKASMEAPESLSDFGQIKRRIIEPAIKELALKDGWLIEWKPIKAGRRVKAVRFEFRRNPQTSLF